MRLQLLLAILVTIVFVIAWWCGVCSVEGDTRQKRHHPPDDRYNIDLSESNGWCGDGLVLSLLIYLIMMFFLWLSSALRLELMLRIIGKSLLLSVVGGWLAAAIVSACPPTPTVTTGSNHGYRTTTGSGGTHYRSAGHHGADVTVTFQNLTPLSVGYGYGAYGGAGSIYGPPSDQQMQNLQVQVELLKTQLSLKQLGAELSLQKFGNMTNGNGGTPLGGSGAGAVGASPNTLPPGGSRLRGGQQNGSYGQPQYGQPQYGQPQYGQPQGVCPPEGMPPKSNLPFMPGVSVNTSLTGQYCAKCHDGQMANKMGGGVVLMYNGQIMPLTDRADVATLESVLRSGNMPKGGPALSLADICQIYTELTTMSAISVRP